MTEANTSAMTAKTSDCILHPSRSRAKIDWAHVSRLAKKLRQGGSVGGSIAQKIGGKYGVISGGHSFLAKVEAGFETIELTVIDRPLSKAELALEEWGENQDRKGFSLIERVTILRTIQTEEGLDQAELAERLGVSESRVSKELDAVRRASPHLLELEARGLAIRSVIAIAKLATHTEQDELADWALETNAKVEAVERESRKRVGRRVRKAKPIKLTTSAGLTILIPEDCDAETAEAELREVMKRLRRGKKIGEDADTAPVMLPGG